MSDRSARSAASAKSTRRATPRRYLMCPPGQLAVTYAINPWMRPGQPVDAAGAS